jgi:hypothetical protein
MSLDTTSKSPGLASSALRASPYSPGRWMNPVRRPVDSVTFLCVPPVLLLVALVACLIPAQRAASLDPVGTLKFE